MKNTSDLRHKARQFIQGWRLCGWAAKNKTSTDFWKALSWWWVEEYETRPALLLEAYTKTLLSIGPGRFLTSPTLLSDFQDSSLYVSQGGGSGISTNTQKSPGLIIISGWSPGFDRKPPNAVQRVLLGVVFGIRYVGKIPKPALLPHTPQESRLNDFLTNDNSN